MNYQQKARSRDYEIIQTLQEWKALNTRQISSMFFPILRIAQRRLAILAERKKINFIRTYDNPAWWFVGKEPKNIDRFITLNWVRIWLLKNKKSWQEYQDWIYDTEGYSSSCQVYNNWQNTYQEIQIEYNPAGKFADGSEAAWSFGTVIKEEREKIKRILVADAPRKGVVALEQIIKGCEL